MEICAPSRAQGFYILTPRGNSPESPQFPLPFSGNLRYNSFRIGRHPPETHRGG